MQRVLVVEDSKVVQQVLRHLSAHCWQLHAFFVGEFTYAARVWFDDCYLDHCSTRHHHESRVCLPI